MTAVHTDKSEKLLTREYFAPPTIGVKKIGEGDEKQTVYEGIGKEFYKSHGFGAKGQPLNSIKQLAALDPSPPDHIQVVFERKCRELEIDPAQEHRRAIAVWDWAESAATLERHLLACDNLQKAGGLRAGLHKDFLGSGDSAALFPAYVESTIVAGMLAQGIVDQVIMGEENASSNTVVVFEFQDAEDERSTSRTSIGARLPRKAPTTGSGNLDLEKFGLAFPVPYEMRALASIDAVSFHIRRIGEQMAIDKSDLLMHIAIAGDGTGTNAGAAETDTIDTDVATAGTIAYSDMLTWCYAAGQAYELNLAIGGSTDLALIANLAEFKDPDVGKSMSRTQFKSPLSINYKQWDGGATGSSYVDRLVVGLDSRRAYKAYRWGPNIQETDRLIEDQLEMYTFSFFWNVAKMDLAATQVLDANAAL